MRNNGFVTGALKDLLPNKVAEETQNILHFKSPLPVAENSTGKKRLILRYVSKHIYTHKKNLMIGNV